jgi:hypothetical protein
MTSLILLDDEGLVQQLALYNNSPDTIRDIKSEIVRRITKRSQFREEDNKTIDQLIKISKTIENIDLDMLSESQRMKELSAKYYKLKNRLLLRLKNESDVLCKTS